jgi:hypothetical protein
MSGCNGRRSPVLARTGHSAMADLSLLLGEERKSDFAFQAIRWSTD